MTPSSTQTEGILRSSLKAADLTISFDLVSRSGLLLTPRVSMCNLEKDVSSFLWLDTVHHRNGHSLREVWRISTLFTPPPDATVVPGHQGSVQFC